MGNSQYQVRRFARIAEPCPVLARLLRLCFRLGQPLLCIGQRGLGDADVRRVVAIVDPQQDVTPLEEAAVAHVRVGFDDLPANLRNQHAAHTRLHRAVAFYPDRIVTRRYRLCFDNHLWTARARSPLCFGRIELDDGRNDQKAA